MKNNLIKKCGNNTCDTIYHNCTLKDKKCLNCGGTIKMINKSTYLKKYSKFYFQYNYTTDQLFYPENNINE